MVIAVYKPKPGQDAGLLELTKEHVSILRKLGFATDRPALAMTTGDGAVVEVFEWVSDQAIAEAHHDPAVLEMWQRYDKVCEYVPYGTLPEASQLFPGFDPIDL